MLEMVRQIPEEAYALENNWFYKIPEDLLTSFMAMEVSGRTADKVFAESFAVYQANSRSRLSRPAIVIRQVDGLYVQHGWEPLQGPLNQEELQAFERPWIWLLNCHRRSSSR